MSKFGNLGLPVDLPAIMAILHPFTNEPMIDKAGKAAFIEMFSSDSNRARAYQRNVTQRRLDQRGRVGLTAVALESEDAGRLAEVTKSWHLVDLDGVAIEVDCTTQNARELYANAEMGWLKEQAETFYNARANFVKPSAKPLSSMPDTSSQASVG